VKVAQLEYSDRIVRRPQASRYCLSFMPEGDCDPVPSKSSTVGGMGILLSDCSDFTSPAPLSMSVFIAEHESMVALRQARIASATTLIVPAGGCSMDTSRTE
jgi:hypothetical protein